MISENIENCLQIAVAKGPAEIKKKCIGKTEKYRQHTTEMEKPQNIM